MKQKELKKKRVLQFVQIYGDPYNLLSETKKLPS